jgi:hypothetical protein
LPLFPLVLVVILAGLLLGGALAHFFGGPKARVVEPTVAALPTTVTTSAPIATTPTPIVTTPAPTMTAATATPRPTVTPSVLATPLRAAVVEPTHTPRAKPLASPSKVHATATPIPAPALTPTPKTVAALPPVTSGDRAAAVVRSYLEALARGDRATAATYLAHGLPTETFMNSGSRIESIRSSSNGAQQYQVTADVQTSSGEYYVTFTVEGSPGGLQITDHYSIKPQ